LAVQGLPRPCNGGNRLTAAEGKFIRGPSADTKNSSKQLCAAQARRRLPMGISTGRNCPSSTGPNRRNNDGSPPLILDPRKREQTPKTWFSILRREIASSRFRNNVFFIWVSHRVRLPPAYPSARCDQRMLAIDFDKRKLSSLNIDFIAANGFASVSGLSARALSRCRAQCRRPP
jgi:hypothetical protein